MKHIKFFESYFGMDIIKLLSPAYDMIKSKKVDKVDKIRLSLIASLDEYKDYIIDLVENRYRKEVDIETEIRRIEAELDNDINRDLNIVNFLRTISNIILIPKNKSNYKIEQRFEEYYETLSSRIERAIESIDLNPTEYLDEEDGEESVLYRSEYIKELKDLQAELNKLLEDVVKSGKKIAIVCEGKDSAGKGSTIKRFIHYMNPKHYRVVTMGVPSKEEMEGENWFKRYENHMPKAGEIVFFDRSYYGMAITNPAMGYCNEEQYDYFMENVKPFEEKLNKEGITLIKLWFSITKEKQVERFNLRKQSPLKYWKFSPNDEKSMTKWDLLTKYKEDCFKVSSTSKNPWVIVQSNDKRLSQLNSIRYVLDKFDYEGKDESVIGDVYPDVVYEIK